MTTIDGKHYYNTQEVAEALHISERTLFSRIEEGKIIGQKVSNRWIFSEDELRRLLGIVKEEQKMKEDAKPKRRPGRPRKDGN